MKALAAIVLGFIFGFSICLILWHHNDKLNDLKYTMSKKDSIFLIKLLNEKVNYYSDRFVYYGVNGNIKQSSKYADSLSDAVILHTNLTRK